MIARLFAMCAIFWGCGVLAAAWTPKPLGGGACSSDLDCQLAGVCTTTNTCQCDAAWHGAHCEYLATLPAQGAAYRQATASSWGGRAFEDGEGTGEFHAFFSEFGGSCGMNEWSNNSHVVHATARGTLDPGGRGYTRAGVAVPVFAHCVDTVKLANGTWILFHNGDGQPRACGFGSPNCDSMPLEWVADCRSADGTGNGTTPANRPVTGHPAPPPPKGFQPHNGVHISHGGPDGPWVAPPAAALRGYPYCDCPAVHALTNGSVAVWCQPWQWNFVPGQIGNTSQPLWINQGWGTPFVAKDVTIDVPRHLIENARDTNNSLKLDDPSLWVDRRGHWHSVMHNGDGPVPCGDAGATGARFRDGNPYPVGCGAHLFSEDGIQWHLSDVAAFNATVALTSGANVDLFRERPKVMIAPAPGGAGHDAVALFTGAMRCGERPIQPGPPPNSYCTNSTWPDDDGNHAGGVGINTFNGLDYSFTTINPLARELRATAPFA